MFFETLTPLLLELQTATAAVITFLPADSHKTDKADL